MKKVKYVIVIVLALGLGMLFSLQSTVSAQECQIIRINDDGNTIRLVPDSSHVNKGTCVIWVNWSTNSDVNIMFEQGKVCKDVVEASMDFKINKDSCFISNLILTKGGTASLVYEKEGSFDYVAKTMNGQKASGKIVVH